MVSYTFPVEALKRHTWLKITCSGSASHVTLIDPFTCPELREFCDPRRVLISCWQFTGSIGCRHLRWLVLSLNLWKSVKTFPQRSLHFWQPLSGMGESSREVVGRIWKLSCPHGVHVFPQVKQIECRKSFQRPTSSNRQPSISVSASFDGERRKVWPYQLLWRAAWDWSCNIFGKSNSASDFDFSWMQRKFSQNSDVFGMFCKLPLPVAAAAISKEIRGMWPGVKRHVKGFSFHVFRSDQTLSCCWKSNISQG